MADALIQLYSGRNPIDVFATIDQRDLPFVNRRKWSIFKPQRSRTIYARSGSLFLHRFIILARAGDEVDHIDGDGLNNRLSNLRLVTHSENMTAARALKPFVRAVKGTGIHRVTKRLATGDVAVYYYHKPTKTRLPGQPGEPDFENALATLSSGF